MQHSGPCQKEVGIARGQEITTKCSVADGRQQEEIVQVHHGPHTVTTKHTTEANWAALAATVFQLLLF
jgi:hypothetical protein